MIITTIKYKLWCYSLKLSGLHSLWNFSSLSHSRKLTPPPIQKSPLGACVFLCQEVPMEETLRECIKWRACVRFKCLARSPTVGRQPVVRLDIWDKLCVITRLRNKVVTGFAACKECHKVSAFDSHERDIFSEETLQTAVAQKNTGLCNSIIYFHLLNAYIINYFVWSR